MTHHALRLRLDTDALQANWRWLQRTGGAPAGAAVKANGYGLGAVEVTKHLAAAGCRDFFVSTWAEAESLGKMPDGTRLSVLHGVSAADVTTALSRIARPVLNTSQQVARWKEIAPNTPCDVMVDTGMNRLGIRTDEIDVLDGLTIATLMSHLASADEESGFNRAQLERFRALRAAVPARTYSLANSAGICLGSDYGFDLTRPGLALYGGLPRAEAEGHLSQVVYPQAEVLQRRTVKTGESVGYGATWIASRDTQIAIANIGYADGYLRSFAGEGVVQVGEDLLPLVGRVSMDLIAFDCTGAPDLSEGDWVTVNYDLPTAADASGLSQYELLTGLSPRFERVWI
ncbi:MAG: alanine racemase [Sphingomicrobium sp.]